MTVFVINAVDARQRTVNFINLMQKTGEKKCSECIERTHELGLISEGADVGGWCWNEMHGFSRDETCLKRRKHEL